MKRSVHVAVLAIASVAVLGMLGAGQLSAATYTWTGATNSTYGTNTNWDVGGGTPAGGPANTDEVIIGAAANQPTNAGTLNRANTTTLNNGGSLTVTGGHFNWNNGGSAVTSTINAGGAVTMSSANNNYFIGIGNSGGAASTVLNVYGTVSLNNIRGLQVSDGNGSMTNRTATMNIYPGAVFSAALGTTDPAQIYGGFLAGRGGLPDQFNVSGGTVNISASTAVNALTAYDRRFTLTSGASLNVSSGDTVISNFALNRLGFDDSNIADSVGTNSKITVGGGTLTINAANNASAPLFAVGASTNYNGEIDVNNGLLAINGTDVLLGNANSALGTLLVDGGSVMLSHGLVLGNVAGATGAFTMNSGTLSATMIGLGAGTGDFFFNGGTVTLAGDQTSIATASWFHPIAGTQVEFDAGRNLTIISVVPEPMSLLLLAGGALCAFGRRRTAK